MATVGFIGFIAKGLAVEDFNLTTIQCALLDRLPRTASVVIAIPDLLSALRLHHNL
jgi:hypothetical protein